MLICTFSNELTTISHMASYTLSTKICNYIPINRSIYKTNFGNTNLPETYADMPAALVFGTKFAAHPLVFAHVATANRGAAL